MGTASVVLGAQNSGSSARSAASASAGSSASGSSGGGSSSSASANGLVTNGEYTYDNNDGSTSDLNVQDFPNITSLSPTITTKNLANLGTIKNVRIDNLVTLGALSPTFVSEIALIAPDGTRVPYKLNQFLTTASPYYPDINAASNALQDTDYSNTYAANHSLRIVANTGTRFSLDLLKPSLISRIEISSDATFFLNIMLTDTFNNYWTTQSTYGTRTSYSNLYSVPSAPGAASERTSTQSARNNNPVAYGASAADYALSNVNFAGRQVFPGIATRFYQYFNYGYDPVYSIDYTATGREGVSLFYQGSSDLETVVRGTAPITSKYDGVTFSIGNVRLADTSSTVWAYTVDPLVDFDAIKALNRDYIRQLFDTKRIIARSTAPIALSTTLFDKTLVKNLQLPLYNPTSGIAGSGAVASSFLLNDKIFSPLPDEEKTSSNSYLSTNYLLEYRQELGTRGTVNSYYQSAFTAANEDAVSSNLRLSGATDWQYDKHNQLEVVLAVNRSPGNKFSLASFGRTYSVAWYSMDGASALIVEPTVTSSDFQFNSVITNYGMEELGNVSTIDISFGDFDTSTDYAAANLQQFLSELSIYPTAGSNDTLDYEVVAYNDPEAGAITAAGDAFLPAYKQFLTDKQDGYAATFNSIVNSGVYPTGALSLATTSLGTRMAYSQKNSNNTTSSFKPLIMTRPSHNGQSIKIRLYNPQPINRIGVYFDSPGFSLPSFSVTTAENLVYSVPTGSTNYQTPSGDDYLSYLKSLDDDALLAANDRTNTIVFPALAQSSTATNVATVAPTTGKSYKTLPKSKGEIVFGASETQLWNKPSQSFDTSSINVTDLSALGSISGGKIQINSLVGSAYNPTNAFNWLKFYDKDGKQIPWVVAGDRSSASNLGAYFKGRLTQFVLNGTWVNLSPLSPYTGAVNSPSGNNYARSYILDPMAYFETHANAGDGAFQISPFRKYTYSGQPLLNNLPVAEFAFIFKDGATHAVSYITYSGFAQNVAGYSPRFSLVLFAEGGKQYTMTAYNQPTAGYAEYWMTLDGALQVVIGKTQTAWTVNSIAVNTTNITYDDSLSNYLTTYSRYNTWSYGVVSERNFVFEAYSERDQKWVPIDAYRFEPDPTKPHNNLYVKVRWSRADGARFINGNFYEQSSIDFSYLRFESTQVPIRSVNANTANLAYTLNNGFGRLEGVTVPNTKGMDVNYSVTSKVTNRTYISATPPTGLYNGDTVKLVFTLTDGSVFYDPLGPTVTYGASFTVDLPTVSGLPEPTTVNLTSQLTGWVQSDSKIRMAYDGSDQNGKISQTTIANLVSLKNSIDRSQIFVRYVLNRQQVDIPIDDAAKIAALALANGKSLSVYIRLIDGNSLTYLQSGSVSELLLNSYTVSGLGLPSFLASPDANTVNAAMYKPNAVSARYELDSAFFADPNWDVFVSLTDQATLVTTTTNTFPPTIPGNVSITIQITPRPGYAFGNSTTYTSVPQVFSASFVYSDISSAGQLVKHVAYDASLLPTQTSGIPGIYGLNDYLGVMDPANSPVINNLVALGLNVEATVNGTLAFRVVNGVFTVNTNQLANGDTIVLTAYPRLGFDWFSSSGIVPSSARISKTYAVSGLIIPTTSVVPDFNNEISGYDGGNTFSTQQLVYDQNTKALISRTSVAAGAIKNYSAQWSSTEGFDARILYLPKGLLANGQTFMSITTPYSTSAPDSPGLVANDSSRLDLKNGDVLVFILLPSGTAATVFATGGSTWVKVITIAGLPPKVDAPPLPDPNDAEAVLNSNVFSGTVTDNSFGASFDPSWFSQSGVTTKVELFSSATDTTPLRQLGSTTPIDGPPFVKDQAVLVTMTRNKRTLWWDDDVLVSPTTMTWKYIVPELPQSGSHIETANYADLQNKTTVTFNGLNSKAGIVINLGGAVPPVDPALTRQTGNSGISMVLTVYTGAVGSSSVAYYKQVPITTQEISAGKVTIAPAMSANVANGQFYTVRFVANYGYELQLNGATRPTSNPWMVLPSNTIVTGLLENLFTAAKLSSPVPVRYAGASGLNATISNLFDTAFLPAVFGHFEVYFNANKTASATSQPTLYTPAAPNHYFVNGETIKVVLIPNHDKYVIDANKTSTDPTTGKVTGNADDIYTQLTVVASIDEPIRLEDVKGQFPSTVKWFDAMLVEGGAFVKLSDDAAKIMAGTATSQGHPIKDAVDYEFAINNLAGTRTLIPVEKMTQGIWLVTSVGAINEETNRYGYASGPVDMSVAGRAGFALVEKVGTATTYTLVAGNSAVIASEPIDLTDNRSLNTSVFGETLSADANFNTATDYRAYETVGNLPEFAANALVQNKIGLSLTLADGTSVALTPNGRPGVNNSYSLTYLQTSTDPNAPTVLVDTPVLDANGNLQIVNGVYTTAIAKIDIYLNGTISSNLTLTGTFLPETKITLYSVDTVAGLSTPTPAASFTATLSTSVRTIIAIPSEWGAIVSQANANTRYYDTTTSYEGSIKWDFTELAKLLSVNSLFAYDLIVTDKDNNAVSTWKNVIPLSTTDKQKALTDAFNAIPAQFLLVGNVATLVAHPVSTSNTFAVDNVPANPPAGFSFGTTVWTIARVPFKSPDVKKAYYVPSNFIFASTAVSGLQGSPVLTGFEAFGFVAKGTDITVELFLPGATTPLDSITVTNPALLRSELESKLAPQMRQNMVLKVTLKPLPTDIIVERKNDGTVSTYNAATPFTKSITITNLNQPLTFRQFAEDNLVYSFNTATGNISASFKNWDDILADSTEALKHLTFTVEHYRTGIAQPLHTATNLTLAQLTDYLQSTVGAAAQTPASNKIALNDTLSIRMKTSTGYLFDDLSSEKSFVYTMRNEYITKSSVVIKAITEAYTTIATGDATPVRVSVNGVSTIQLPESIAVLNAKGIKVTIVVNNGAALVNQLPANVTNGAIIRISLEPINALANTIQLEGETTARTLYTVNYIVKDLLLPSALDVPATITVAGTLNSQGNLDLSWITPASQFLVTTWVDDVATATRVTDLRNGQKVRLQIKPAPKSGSSPGRIIRITADGSYRTVLDIPEFTVANLKDFIQAPEIPDALLLIYNPTTQAVTFPRFQNSSILSFMYEIEYMNANGNTSAAFTSLSLADFKGAVSISFWAVANEGYVFNAQSATQTNKTKYALTADGTNPLIDLPTGFAEKNLTRTGLTYILPEYAVPTDVASLSYIVGSGAPTAIKPASVSATSVASISVNVAKGKAAIATVASYTIPALNRNNIIQVGNTDFSGPTVYGVEGSARLIFNDNILTFAAQTGVVTELVVKRDGVIIFNGDPSQSFVDQLAEAQQKLKNNDILELNFVPAENMVFASPAGDQQHILSEFRITDLAPADVNSTNTAAIAISVAAVAAIGLLGVPAYFFARRVNRQ